MKDNFELTVLEFMKEKLGQGGIKFEDFPENLFPDRQKLNSLLLSYDKSNIAIIHAVGFPRQVDMVLPKSELIKVLEDKKVEYERAFKTESVYNIINVEHMEHSQIQQATTNSLQNLVISGESVKSLSKFIDSLKMRLPDLELKAADNAEITADISTIEAQINSTNPKANILRESLSSIQRILENATGSLVASEFLKYIPGLLALF